MRARQFRKGLAGAVDGEEGFNPDRPGQVDGLQVVYDREYQVMLPTPTDLAVIDRTLALVSGCVAPGAPRPDHLSARPDNDALPYFLAVTRVANDVGVPAGRMAPAYTIILEAYLAMKSGEGPDEVILEPGELGDEGYVVALTRGRQIQVDVRPRRTGASPGIGVSEMILHGFRPEEIVASQLAFQKTPDYVRVSLRRASGED